jgi:G3E family GTPase
VVPLVILTGFLGSGKTTLLNHLLAARQEHGVTQKLGLIVNELGEIGVDGDLLPQGSTRQIELAGGCVCCVLSDDLGATILEMLKATPDLEAIVLETTGVAEPLPLAWALERPPVAEHVRLAAVITLVDSTNFLASRPLSPAVDSQVAYADILLLTKAAVSSPAEQRETEAAVRALAPRVELRAGSTTEHAEWLRTLLADPRLEEPLPSHGVGHRAAAREAAPGHDGHDGHDHHAADHHHDHRDHRDPAGAADHLLDHVATMLPDELVDLEELEDQLAALPSHYVRIKGIVRAVDGRRANSGPGWYAFHRVGMRVSSEPLAAATSPRVVALGRGVVLEEIQACLENSVMS